MFFPTFEPLLFILLYNAAIKPRGAAVAHRRCKRRELKAGACSRMFNFGFWSACTATAIAEAEQ